MPRSTVDDGPHPVDRHVGRRVCAKRMELGYNQSDLGRALGLTFQQVQKYEKGTNRISASKLWDISRFLGVNIAYFFEGLSGTVSDGEDSPVESWPVSRQSIEIARTVPQLSVRRQKLALDLLRDLADRPKADLETEAP